MENYYGFVYITTNLINGKRYIGQRSYFKPGYEEYLGSGKALLRAIRKHGRSNFSREIVGQAFSKKELDNLERQIISEYDAVESRDFYNLVPGGHGCSMGFLGKSHSEETKKKMRKAAMGHPVSEYTRKRVSETPKNWKKMIETRVANGTQPRGAKHPRAVAVIWEGNEYPTITAAAEATGEKWSYVRRHALRLTKDSSNGE